MGVVLRYRHGYDEPASFAERALYSDRSLLSFNDPFDDRKPQTRSFGALYRTFCALHLLEFIKDTVELV